MFQQQWLKTSLFRIFKVVKKTLQNCISRRGVLQIPISCDLMGRITSSGCARNDQITRDKVECDPVVPGAATRHEPTHQIKLLR